MNDNNAPMLSQAFTERTGHEPMLALECAPGGVSQASLFGAPEHMKLFYGVCDWCDTHWWDNSYEAHAWQREDLPVLCECGEEIEWYEKDAAEAACVEATDMWMDDYKELRE